MMWRCVRLQLEAKYPERVSVIPDVTDLIDRMRQSNDRIRGWLAVHPYDFKYVKIVAADMQGMTEKVLNAQQWASENIWMDDGQLEFMRDALHFESRHSLFLVGKDLLYSQPDGRGIGEASAGPTCGGTYYLHELVNAYPALETLPSIEFLRYENGNRCSSKEQRNVAVAAGCVRRGLDIEPSGIAFLDVWLSLDPRDTVHSHKELHEAGQCA